MPLETLELQKKLLATNVKAEEQRPERNRLTALASGLQSEIAQIHGQYNPG